MRVFQLYSLLFICALEAFPPPPNDLLQLAPLPTTVPLTMESNLNDIIGFEYLHRMLYSIGFKGTLCHLMFVDTIVFYYAEKSLIGAFET